MTFDLNKKIAVVTASSNGIGLEIGITLAKHNAVVYLAARNQTKVQKILSQYPDLDLHFVYFDATKPETYNQCIKTILKEQNHLHILVNNFGFTDVAKDKTIWDTTPSDFINIVTENLNVTYTLTQCAIQNKNVDDDLSIINISSIGAIVPDISRIAYTTVKATINAFTKTVALQAAMQKVRCNAIMPGMIGTDAVLNNLPQSFLDLFLKNVPLERIGKTSDIANLTLFLSSDEANYITGQCIAVSGGFGLGSPLYAWMKKAV